MLLKLMKLCEWCGCVSSDASLHPIQNIAIKFSGVVRVSFKQKLCKLVRFGHSMT